MKNLRGKLKKGFPKLYPWKCYRDHYKTPHAGMNELGACPHCYVEEQQRLLRDSHHEILYRIRVRQ